MKYENDIRKLLMIMIVISSSFYFAFKLINTHTILGYIGALICGMTAAFVIGSGDMKS